MAIFSLYLRNNVPYYQALPMDYTYKLEWQSYYQRLSCIVYSISAGSMYLYNNELFWVYNVPTHGTSVMYRIKI